MALFADAIAAFRRNPTPQPSSWLPYITPTRDGSLSLTDGTTASYTTIARENVWVRAAIDTIAYGLMMMPIHVYQRTEGRKVREYDSGLYRLLEVKPYTGITPSDYRAFIGKCVATYGNAIVIKGITDPSEEPPYLMPAPPLGWKIEGEYYVWTDRNGDEYPFKRWQIAHYRFWDVDESGFGIPPMEALRRTVANDDAARRYATSTFTKGARPGSILKTDKALNDDTAKRLAANWKALHEGPDNAGGLAILTDGLDYALLQHDLEKSAVTAHRDFTPVEVGAAFRIPAAILGHVKEANFASMDMYQQMLYQNALGPWVVMLEERTQLDIVDPTSQWAGQFVEVNQHGVLRGNTSQQYRNYATGITTGFLTPNEVRAMENLPPSDQPDADKLLFPMNLSGAVGAQTAEDDGTIDDETGDADA